MHIFFSRYEYGYGANIRHEHNTIIVAGATFVHAIPFIDFVLTLRVGFSRTRTVTATPCGDSLCGTLKRVVSCC